MLFELHWRNSSSTDLTKKIGSLLSHGIYLILCEAGVAKGVVNHLLLMFLVKCDHQSLAPTCPRAHITEKLHELLLIPEN